MPPRTDFWVGVDSDFAGSFDGLIHAYPRRESSFSTGRLAMADGRRWRTDPFAGRARQLHEMWWHKTGQWLDPDIWDPVWAGWIKQFGKPVLTDAIQQIKERSVWKNGVPNIHDVPRFA